VFIQEKERHDVPPRRGDGQTEGEYPEKEEGGKGSAKK